MCFEDVSGGFDREKEVILRRPETYAIRGKIRALFTKGDGSRWAVVETAEGELHIGRQVSLIPVKEITLKSAKY